MSGLEKSRSSALEADWANNDEPLDPCSAAGLERPLDDESESATKATISTRFLIATIRR